MSNVGSGPMSIAIPAWAAASARSAGQECAFAAVAVLKDDKLGAVEGFELRAIENGAHVTIGNARASTWCSFEA